MDNIYSHKFKTPWGEAEVILKKEDKILVKVKVSFLEKEIALDKDKFLADVRNLLSWLES